MFEHLVSFDHYFFTSSYTLSGGTSRTRGQSKRADQALFQTRASIYGYTKTIEVAFTASSLNSNDAFVVFNGFWRVLRI